MTESRKDLIDKRVIIDGKIYTIYAVATSGVFAHEGETMEVNEKGEVINPKFLFYDEVEGNLIGPGRPAVGKTKKISLTMPEEVWEQFDTVRKQRGLSQSALLREIVESWINNREWH